MVTKSFGIDFFSEGGALTLSPSVVEDNNVELPDYVEFTKTHENGWTITAFISENYYRWVNEFSAVHPVFGNVWGDFQNFVYADSEEGFQDFYNKFPPNEGDYHDI